jgi:hypothetical protein
MEWKSRAHPSVPAQHVITGDDREQAAAELTRLGQVLGLDDAVVCITHMRFIPCGVSKTGCAYAADEESVELVRLHQQG